MIHRVSIIAFVLLSAVALCSCNLLSNINGKVAGQVMDENGVGRGLVSVSVIDAETGSEVARETANDGGHFLINDVPSGNYTIQVKAMGNAELPTDVEPFYLGPGKTEDITVVIQNPST